MKSFLSVLFCAAITASQAVPALGQAPEPAPAPAQAPAPAAQSPAPAEQTPAPAAGEELEKVKMALFRAQRTLVDWANLGRYKGDNEALLGAPGDPNRVVFMGDSITDMWGKTLGKSFPGKPYVDRGISGQTTPQMLIRFRPDVINLKPKAVLILAGTNDLAGNTGPMTVEETEGNLQSMAELGKAAGLKVLLASLTPVSDVYHKMTDRRPPDKIIALNQWIQAYCAKNGLVYVDYYSAMLDDQKALKKDLTDDGLHPNAAGYDVMGPIAAKAIAQAIGQ